MARGIELLHNSVQSYARRLVEECKNQGLLIQITDTLRTKSEQDALYSQGRTKPGNIVTNAKYPQSNHCWGIAFDICRADGKGAYYDGDGFFAKVGAVGKSIGLDWGGDWKSIVDKPHFEYSGYGTWRALQNKYGTPEKFLGNAGTSVSTDANLLKKGSKGSAVTELQNMLNNLGYNCGAADGIFGENTFSAVKAFQSDYGLTVDGVVGKNTKNALEGAKKLTSSSVDVDPLIKEYQQALNTQYGKGLTVDGIYGNKTENAAVNVRKGSKGVVVTVLQKLLSSRTNYFSGEWDGIFGTMTETAIVRYQRENGLDADGIAGKNTWRHLLTNGK